MVVNNISVVKTLLIALTLTFTTFQECYSQGAWNMQYYPLDSLNNAFEGKEIRLDLKKSDLDVYDSKVNIRRHFNTNDSAYVIIDNRSKLFVERWKIYVDHGVLSDQYLECTDTSSKKRLVIREIYLKSVNDKSLTLEGNFYILSKDKEELSNNRKVFQIPRSLVKGFLTRIND